jgi:dTDP-4-dehydrorhamnose reductase
LNIGVVGGNQKIGRHLRDAWGNFILGDTTNYKEFHKSIVDNAMDFVVCFPANDDVDWCEENKENSIQLNVRGTATVLTACMNANVPVVVVTDDNVFGVERWYSKNIETRKPAPRNQFGWTEYGMEQLALRYEQKVVRRSILFDDDAMEQGLSFGKQYESGKCSPMHVEHFIRQMERYLAHYSAMPDILHLAGADITRCNDVNIGESVLRVGRAWAMGFPTISYKGMK